MKRMLLHLVSELKLFQREIDDLAKKLDLSCG